MSINLKKWAGLGLGTAVLGTGLVACGGEEGETGESGETAQVASADSVAGEGEGEGDGEAVAAASTSQLGEGAGEGEGGEGEGERGEAAGGSVAAQPLPNRLAFMSGHVEAGLALYRAGEPEMAAKHLLHPVSESYEAEREGLDALGFEPALFETVSRALENGEPASEIEPQLAAAAQNLAEMAEQAGGEPAEVIRYLMDVIVEEYTIAVSDGVVTDSGEYQDAWGFAVVARKRAEAMTPRSRALIDEIATLVDLWPEDAPLPPQDPAPVAQVTAQTSQVALALPQ